MPEAEESYAVLKPDLNEMYAIFDRDIEILTKSLCAGDDNNVVEEVQQMLSRFAILACCINSQAILTRFQNRIQEVSSRLHQHLCDLNAIEEVEG